MRAARHSEANPPLWLVLHDTGRCQLGSELKDSPLAFLMDRRISCEFCVAAALRIWRSRVNEPQPEVARLPAGSRLLHAAVRNRNRALAVYLAKCEHS